MDRIGATVALLLIASIPAAAQPTTLWSATLTAGSSNQSNPDGTFSSIVGYSSFRGELSDPHFDFRGTSHEVRELYQNLDTGSVFFVFAPPSDELDVNSMTLTVDGHRLAVGDATRVSEDDDEIAVDPEVTITWSDPGFRWEDGQSVAVQLTTSERPSEPATGLSFEPASVTVAEGRTKTYTVGLAMQPSDTVTVAVTSDDTGAVEVSPASLTFTTANWNSRQTVTVAGVDDDDALDEITGVMHVASGGGYDDVSRTLQVTVADDDEVDLSFSTQQVTVPEGDTATYTVGLTAQPPDTVTVELESEDTGAVQVSPALLTFTTANWNDPLTVTVTGVVDDDTSDEMVSIIHTGSAIAGYRPVANVVVTVSDDDDDEVPVPVLPPAGLVLLALALASAAMRARRAAFGRTALRSETMRTALSFFVLFLTLITTASAQAPGIRVFITDDLDLRNNAEWTLNDFVDRSECQGLTVTSRPWRAHFTITAQRGEGEIVDLSGGNWVGVFDGWGDMLYSGSTRQFGNALKDACEAIDRHVQGGAELITVGEADPALFVVDEHGH